MKLHRFQISLLTAIILQFEMGVLIWANLRPYHQIETTSKGGFSINVSESFGWPCEAFNRFPERWIKFTGQLISPQWITEGIIANLATAFAIVILTYFICEWWINKRSPIKTNTSSEPAFLTGGQDFDKLSRAATSGTPPSTSTTDNGPMTKDNS